eukprot:jgi/Galph1/4527/GphlegSOOS_G3195.1
MAFWGTFFGRCSRRSFKRLFSASTETTTPVDESKQWKIFSAAILERIPPVLKPLTGYEQDYRLYRFEAKLAYARKMPSGWFPNGQREDPVTGEVLLGDFARRHFIPAPIETEADHTGNLKTLDRKLTDSVYFLVKRGNQVWQFPQDEAEVGKTLKQKAEETVKQFTGSQVDVHFIGNAPACHIEHMFSAQMREKRQLIGAKIFFYRAIVVDGNLENIPFDHEFAWVTAEEIGGLVPSSYYEAVKNIL